MLSANERMLKIATANYATLAKVDAVLLGDDTHVPKVDPDVRTCTLTEAARRLGLSRPTIYRLIKRKALHTVQLDGVSRVVLQSIFDYAHQGWNR